MKAVSWASATGPCGPMGQGSAGGPGDTPSLLAGELVPHAETLAESEAPPGPSRAVGRWRGWTGHLPGPLASSLRDLNVKATRSTLTCPSSTALAANGSVRATRCCTDRS